MIGRDTFSARAPVLQKNSLCHPLSTVHSGQHDSKFPELQADLFSRHSSPLEVHVFVAVANRGEDVMSDEICRRFNGKQP